MKDIRKSGKSGFAALSATALTAALAMGMFGCAPASSTSGSTAASSGSQSATTSGQTQGQQSTSSNGPSFTQDNVKFTADQALDRALDAVMLTKSQIEVIKNEFEVDDGTPIYEIEFHGPENMEYEFEINANTGDVITYDSEPIGQ